MVLNLNQVILKMENMLGRLIGEDVNMVKRLDPNLKSVFMDPGQIEQILINLTINAREAMPGGGTITFETGNTSLSPDQPHQRLGLQAGDFVRLGVHDTGTGMSEEEQQHLFEPFYTTKPFGERAGFGLATCYTIVQQNDGYITVDSTPGAGSSFVVYLPVAQSTETTESKTPDTGSQKPGTERVLLVEDDSSVRKYVSEVLRECGYSVLEAGSGIEALLLVNEHPDQRIDLLISDMVMPQMSGRGLADVLQSRYPDLKVLFISGYPPETISMRGVDSNSIALLSKPFTEDKFIGRVREILDSP
jgi:CheY-like chemotaxis protein